MTSQQPCATGRLLPGDPQGMSLAPTASMASIPNMPGMASMDDELRSLVRRHQVTWETRPELAPKDRGVAPIGYVIELSAVPEHPDHAEAIACAECDAVEDALDRLTAAIAPSEVRHVGRGTRQIGTAHDLHPESTATVAVLHRDGGGANRPPDDDERRRLTEIVDRLRGLGAQERHWHDPT
jgi:hypothetical protein